MIKLYISPFCASCRKAKEYFKEKKIPVTLINIFTADLKKEDIIEMLEKSDYGTEEIVSERSKIVKEQNPDFDSMTIDEFASFIVANPTVLKRPIIVDDRKIQVGYDPDEITAFRKDIAEITARTCANCPFQGICQHMPYPEETQKYKEEKKRSGEIPKPKLA